MVVDFVVGRVLSGNGGSEAVSGLDEVTTYYLLHRHTFGLNETPSGPCILYAISCGLTDGALADQYDVLVRTGGQEAEEDSESEAEEGEGSETVAGSGSQVKLKPWNQRRRPGLGYPSIWNLPTAGSKPPSRCHYWKWKASSPRRAWFLSLTRCTACCISGRRGRWRKSTNTWTNGDYYAIPFFSNCSRPSLSWRPGIVKRGRC